MSPLTDVASGEWQRDRLSRLLLVLGIVSLITAVAITAFALSRDTTQWNPLAAYPVQQVTGEVFHLDQPVLITARKCAKHDGVQVRGQKSWVALLSPGVRITEAAGASGLRYKSCGPEPHVDHFSYRNLIPSAVAAIVIQSGPSLWRIEGLDIPFEPTGREGVPRAWQSEPFRLER